MDLDPSFDDYKLPRGTPPYLLKALRKGSPPLSLEELLGAPSPGSRRALGAIGLAGRRIATIAMVEAIDKALKAVPESFRPSKTMVYVWVGFITLVRESLHPLHSLAVKL